MGMGKLFTQVQKLWNAVGLHVLVLVSLFFQIVLIAYGSRRKYRKNRYVAGIIWLFYLSADTVATYALGVLSRGQNDGRYTIMAFWAPFLLIHLGGPDTITAYALADNELWLRHFLGLLTQGFIAVYVFLKSWKKAQINYLCIPIFVAGCVKYGERISVLYKASEDEFRESILSRPDPGPDYAKLMDALVCKEREGYDISLDEKIINTVSCSEPTNSTACNGDGTSQDDINVLLEAYHFFGTFKKLFGDFILSFQDKERSLSFFEAITWDKAFSIVEVELGLVYDLFHTKALILYSWCGFVCRTISCLCTIAAFFTFLFIDKKDYPETEVIVTRILLGGAVSLEIYAALIILSSDWVMIWLKGDWTTIPAVRKFKDCIALPIRSAVSGLRKLHIVPARRRWSNSMGQHNVLDCCIKGKIWFPKIRKFLEKHLFWRSKSVPKGLKELIFEELKIRVDTDEKNKGDYRGDRFLLKEMECFDKSDEIEFNQSVLLWHVATDLCYHTDVVETYKPDQKWLTEFILNNKEPSSNDNLRFKREICRLLSNYMMHLLIKFPSMLPSGIGLIRFQDTCAEAKEFFNKKKLDKKKACEMLIDVEARFQPSKVKGDRSKSLLFDACRLAKSLQSLQDVDRWKIITQAWLDMLTFAAAQCRWNNHAEKLSQGGELLTHVWLLMAHFGMTDQFQISKGYIRAKLQLA